MPPDEMNPEQQDEQQQQQSQEDATQGAQQPTAGGGPALKSYPLLEAALAVQETGTAPVTAAAPAPAAKPAAGAAKPAAGEPRRAPVVAQAIKLRQQQADLARREAALKETEAGLAKLRDLEAKMAAGDRVGLLRALAKDDADYYQLITENAQHAAGVKVKDATVAAKDLPPAVQAELARLRELAGEVPKLKEDLEGFKAQREQALRSITLEEQTRKAEAVWTAGWGDVQSAAAELPHVAITGETPEEKEAAEEARQMVEARFLELAQAERAKTRAAIPEARAKALVVEAARDVNGRLAKLLKRGAGPGNVTPGRPTAAPRATSPRQPSASASQGTGRPKVIPATMGSPAPVDRRRLPDTQLKKLAAEGLARKFPDLAK